VTLSEFREKITCKAHQRANLNHSCFVLLVKAFITYARPILEYNSPLWSPTLKKDIISIESVQSKFTKRIPGMSGLSYHPRLKALNLECRLVASLQNIIWFTMCKQWYIFHSKKPVTLRGHAHICYTNSDVSALIDAIFSALELLVCGTACPPKLRTSPD